MHCNMGLKEVAAQNKVGSARDAPGPDEGGPN